LGVKLGKNNIKKFKLDPFAYYIYSIVIFVMVIVFIFQFLVATPVIQSPEYLTWYRRFLYFDYMFLLFFSGTAVISGIFLAYLGYGSNRKIGAYFIVLGIVVFTLGFIYFDIWFPRPIYNPSNVYQALVSVLGTIAGFLAAILVAFIVITKVGPHISRLGKRTEFNGVKRNRSKKHRKNARLPE
jgi:hypothetical protein